MKFNLTQNSQNDTTQNLLKVKFYSEFHMKTALQSFRTTTMITRQILQTVCTKIANLNFDL